MEKIYKVTLIFEVYATGETPAEAYDKATTADKKKVLKAAKFVNAKIDETPCEVLDA